MLADAAANWISLAVHIALVPALLVLSAGFSGSEAALFSLTRVQLDRAAASPSHFRRLAVRLMSEPKRALLIILVGNTTVNVLLFANCYILFDQLGRHVGGWIAPAGAVLSVLLVVLCGEVVPKVLGVSLADRLAPVAAAVVNATSYVAGPLGLVIDRVLVVPFERVLLGAPAHAASDGAELSRVELKALLEMSRRGGALLPLEDTFLRSIIDLGHARVRDVMIPRVQMTGYEIHGSPDGLRELIRSTRHKKIPVYDRSMDSIVGLVYAKILFFNPTRPLRELVQPVRFVPELITCEQLLVHFRSTRSQLAIAVDEYGGVAGLVTLEDVIEQIVGELHDPEDHPAEAEIQILPDGRYDISGQLSVHYWIEAFGLPEQIERVATVGGLVMARLGRPARVGDVVRLNNVELCVTQMRRRRIDRLELRLLDASSPNGDRP
jgi:CBS domain containing-hemolysin-like protein